VVKAWHYHKHATINYAVPVGRIRFVLYDTRKDGLTYGQIQEVELGDDKYALATVPPGIWSGFTPIGDEMALVANCTTLPHDPEETDRRDINDPTIPYDWSRAFE